MGWWAQGPVTILSVTDRQLAGGHPGLTLPVCLPPQFRLKRCGLGHRIYLVEEHCSANNLSLPESTLLQAVTNTQVSRGGRARLAGTPWSTAPARIPSFSWVGSSSSPGHRRLLCEAYSGH